ncbi:4-hydroxy-tetrahydrodipicolinate reductase [Leadbettera azotonutricia]|uniref:4-hydroxy-tetrahydrodipicolinate reductase n=1 Tax=Leadbettera azotonutricia (strain ATCC BAA-888 / DSM 13862 / ZAS-9) TaxID=545695 RepID=F5YG03_LEAAZ|nr:4-hydroxy-tetrahydrodipicolinate reductase [Leadbettera azotonutricia]AEF83392.1 dihydrodipicolinate reductase [Leadbettera azotonutricia ZAS-9]
MKLALVGYGKMGRILEARALEKGHSIAAVIDPFVKGTADSGAPVYGSLAEALKGGLGQADGAIEFTRPDTAPENIKFLAEHKIPVTVGTTGWYAKLPEITAAVNAAGASLLWASNFSLGVNLFYLIAAHAASLFDPFAEYDVGGFEVHHNKKADSPSGTAITLAEKVLSRMKRKTKAVYDKLDRPPRADELHFASLRAGSVPGVHSLVFDSQADTIEITHTARNREGLAAGAILAAEWLGSRSGVYTMDDVLADILNRSIN